MGEDEVRSLVIGDAVRRSWSVIKLLVPLIFVCVTVAVLVLPGLSRGTAAEVGEAMEGLDGGSACEVSGSADQRDGSEPVGWQTAVALGSLAAVLTAIGTATARVMIAVAQLRLATASSEAIRAGHQPPVSSTDLAGQDDDGTPQDPA